MRCAVFNCTNNNNNKQKQFRFFSFPKDKILLKKWINFCQRDNFNTNTARICSAHFKPNDFERNLQYEMGFSKQNIFKLTPGTVPTVSIADQDETPISQQQVNQIQPQPIKKQKQNISKLKPMIVSTVSLENKDENPISQQPVGQMQSQPMKQVILLLHKAPPQWSQASVQQIKSDSKTTNIESNTYLVEKIRTLEKEAETLRRENYIMKEEEKKHTKQMKLLKQCLTKAEFQKNNLEEKLKKIFTTGQINKLKNSPKRLTWGEADITQSIALYSVSPKAYKLLQMKNFPLPAVRTLQTWVQKKRKPKEIQLTSTDLQFEEESSQEF